MDLEKTAARLEEQAYFQERLLSQLNDALTGQQKQLDLLEKRVEQMENSLNAVLEALRDAPQNTLPPHYMPERY